VSASRSYRNNNPGNLEFGAFAAKCRGVIETGVPKPRFARFPHAAAGVTALSRLLSGPSYDKLTIESSIRKFAPPKENLVQAYINTVCDEAGVLPSTRIMDLDALQFISFLHGVTDHEGYHK
jgi:hypothetical protein